MSRSPDGRAAGSTFAVVLAGGRGLRLQQLTDWRAKPAMPIAGHLKIIDFTLSNCLNSGVRRIAVLTQYKAQSLIRHITRGWGFLDASLDEFVDVVPAQQRVDTGWYSGTADAVFQNLDMVRDARPKYVLVLAGDHVYKMDYGVMLAEHAASGAEVTLASVEVPIEDAHAYGVLQTDGRGRVTAFDEKPGQPRPLPGRTDRALASMGVYVFNADYLYRVLAEDAGRPDSCHDFGANIVPRAVAAGQVHAHDFQRSCINSLGHAPYWRDVGTLDAYWEANIDLTRRDPQLVLHDDTWPIRTLQHQLPPAKFLFDEENRRGMTVDSLVASGCVVSGSTVRRSVLFSKVSVGDGSEIDESLVLPDVVVGRHVVLRRAIVDKHCVLPDGLKVGLNPAQDRARFTVTDKGVTLVTPEMLGQCVHSRI